MIVNVHGQPGARRICWEPCPHGFRSGSGTPDIEGAREARARATDMVAVLGRYGGVRAAKQIMAPVGLDCGPARLLLRGFTDAGRDALRADLEGAGFFDYAMQA